MKKPKELQLNLIMEDISWSDQKLPRRPQNSILNITLNWIIVGIFLSLLLLQKFQIRGIRTILIAMISILHK